MHLSIPYILSCLIWCIRASESYNSTTTSTCQALASTFPETLFYPETEPYNTSISSYPFLQLRLHPTCLIRPNSAQDVSKVVNILRKSGSTKFAVRGGGHNANAGFNNIEDGVTIDMRGMNSVTVDPGDKVVRVGAGAVWQNVYDVVETRNLSVLGGRIGVVGVAGFITGGGVSFFGPERGWACDYVVNFEIVLASGAIVNANATSRPDLFAALKGGQSNFGIMTRFDLRAFPQGKIWGGKTQLAPEADLDLITAFSDFKKPENFDPYAAGWVTVRYNGTSKLLTPTTILWYTKPELKPGALKNLTSLGPEIPGPPEVVAYPGEFAKNASMVLKGTARNTIWATNTFHSSPTINHNIYSTWKRLIPSLCETYAYAKLTAELTFQALPPVPDASLPNSMGIAQDSSPEKDLVFLQTIFYFEDAAASDGLNNALKDFVKMFDDLAVKEGKKNRFVYLNFAAWFQDPLKAYGEEQWRRLRGTARKYDPEGFFQKQLAGGFKLGVDGYRKERGEVAGYS